jgi:hypothetical protein
LALFLQNDLVHARATFHCPRNPFYLSVNRNKSVKPAILRNEAKIIGSKPAARVCHKVGRDSSLQHVGDRSLGDWRVIFIEDNNSIIIVAVGNRREIYD